MVCKLDIDKIQTGHYHIGYYDALFGGDAMFIGRDWELKHSEEYGCGCV